MRLGGYGKVLEIDLSSGQIKQKDIDPQFARDYIGGMGFGVKILFDEVGPEVDPLSPANIIVFANGPLTGTRTPCSGRTEITTKSPLTGSIGSGNTGGLWGAALKRAGFDIVVIRGQATNPVYVWIDDGKIEIRDAAQLWGKDTHATTDAICQDLDPSGSSKPSVLTIGQAGENLVKYSCPINDYHHCAARSGAGAVMGAKKLKAIAVRGTGSIRIAREEEFQGAVKKAMDRLMEANNANSILLGKVADVRKSISDMGSLPGKNFQTGIMPNWETRGAEETRKYLVGKEGTCYGCPLSCFNLVEVKTGKYAGVRVSRATAPGTAVTWGAGVAIDNLPAIWKCKELCEHFGMDYGSAGMVVAFAMELFQRGVITRDDTGGLDLTWGNEDATVELLRKIAHREGFGDVLAEGSVKAAEKIGKGASRCVMAMKGVEINGLDPRAGWRGFVFGDIVNPRGGDNIKTTHFTAEQYNPNWWIDKYDMFEDVKEKIFGGIPPQEFVSTWEGKPLLSKWFGDLYTVANSLGICIFTIGTRLAWGPTYLAELLSACTGWDITPQDMVTAGEKNFNLLKAYTVREGLARKDDVWPDRFYTEPLPEGPAKGAMLSRDVMDGLLDEYYDLRGWDRETSWPGEKKLRELGLDEVANDLKKRGKLPVE